MAEGGGLLNRYTVKSRIEGSNPSVSATVPWVHSGHMGDGLFQRHRSHFRADQFGDPTHSTSAVANLLEEIATRLRCSG